MFAKLGAFYYSQIHLRKHKTKYWDKKTRNKRATEETVNKTYFYIH
jgi:hypothetical protein